MTNDAALLLRLLAQIGNRTMCQRDYPRGKVEPSLDDVATTEAIYKALDAAGIELVDHVIVSGADYYSMEKNCRIPAWEAPSVYSGRV